MRVLAALVVVFCVLAVGANAQDHWKKAVRPSGLGGKAPASESAHSTLSAAGEFVVAGKTGQEVLSALHLVVPGAIAHLAKQPAKAKTSSAEYLGGHFATVAGLIQKSSVKPSPKASAVVSLSGKDLSVSELATAVKLANAGAKPAFRFAEAANAGAHHSSADKKIAAHRAKSEASHGSSSSAKVFVVVVKASGKPRFAHHSSADKKIAAHRAKSESAKHSGSAAAWKVTAATKPIKGLVHPNLFVVDEHYNVVAAPSAAELKKKL